MELREYLAGLERGGAAKLAMAIGVTPSYLSQLAAGTTPRSPARCVQIEHATGGLVSRKDLRPNDWHEIWPELGDNSVTREAA
jgi:DNA-binding transcriptional regulator YdaS (Cro superfamily)